MTTTIRISTLRHAETDFVREHRYCGTIDAPLSEAGIRDAKGAAKRMSQTRFDVVITSALRRTYETARLLLGPEASIIRSPLCNERCFGVLQGREMEEAEMVRPRVRFIRVGGDYHSVFIPGGETFPAVRRRARTLLSSIFAEHAGLSVLVVSHGTFLQQFHGAMRGLPWAEALTDHTKPLVFRTFAFRGKELVGETEESLSAREQDQW